MRTIEQRLYLHWHRRWLRCRTSRCRQKLIAEMEQSTVGLDILDGWAAAILGDAFDLVTAALAQPTERTKEEEEAIRSAVREFKQNHEPVWGCRGCYHRCIGDMYCRYPGRKAVLPLTGVLYMVYQGLLVPNHCAIARRGQAIRERLSDNRGEKSP